MLEFLEKKGEAYQKRVNNHYMSLDIYDLDVEQLKEYYEKLKK